VEFTNRHKIYNNHIFLLGVPRSLTLTGRSSVPSPRAQAVGTQGGKKSLQARFFAAASPAASALAGFPPAPSRNRNRNWRVEK